MFSENKFSTVPIKMFRFWRSTMSLAGYNEINTLFTACQSLTLRGGFKNLATLSVSGDLVSLNIKGAENLHTVSVRGNENATKYVASQFRVNGYEIELIEPKRGFIKVRHPERDEKILDAKQPSFMSAVL